MAGYKRVVLTEKDKNIAHPTMTQSNYVGTAKKQLAKFDNNYTSKKLNELYNEFDAITFDTQSVSANTIIEHSATSRTSSAYTFKTKLYLTGAVLITLLLAFLSIYNIFVINSLNGGIKLLQEEVSVAQATYNNVYAENQTLNDPSVILEGVNAGGFTEVSSNSVVNITPLQQTQIQQLSAPSNWFNEFCNFLGALFGG